MTSTVTHLPTSHVQSLKAIEDGYWWFQGRVHWAIQLIRQFQAQARGNDDLNYVDLGCGTGGFARNIIQEFNIRKTALVDADPAVLKLAEMKPGMEAHQLDFNGAFDLPWRPNLLTCMDVLEHIEHDAAFLKRAVDQLAWGGACLISVPAFPSLFSEWDRRLGHFRRYTPDTLKNVIKTAGLTPLSVKFMWSFLMPAVPIRKMRSKRYADNMEFEAVSPAVNRTLIRLSQWEWKVSQLTPLPFGTSLIALTTKK